MGKNYRNTISNIRLTITSFSTTEVTMLYPTLHNHVSSTTEQKNYTSNPQIMENQKEDGV
jgi:hypothetical protein